MRGNVALLLLGPLFSLACGCATNDQAVVLDPPALWADPAIAQETTLLGQCREITALYETEKSRAAALDKALAEAKATNAKAEQQIQELQKQAGELAPLAKSAAELRIKIEEQQKTLLSLTENLRDAQREVLEERLARVKSEQVLVTMKIDAARAKRKQLIADNSQESKEISSAPPQKQEKE